MRFKATMSAISAPSDTRGRTCRRRSLTGEERCRIQQRKDVGSHRDGGKAKEREKEEANSPKFLPGPHFLGTGGVFLLDQYNGKPELAEILQNGSELNQLHKQQQLANGTIPLRTRQLEGLVSGPDSTSGLSPEARAYERSAETHDECRS